MRDPQASDGPHPRAEAFFDPAPPSRGLAVFTSSTLRPEEGMGLWACANVSSSGGRGRALQMPGASTCAPPPTANSGAPRAHPWLGASLT